jgi:hypothetical protein
MRAAIESTLMELAHDPLASEPVVRVAKRTLRGPISTAPLPLSTPRGPASETIAESTIGPTEGATVTVASWKTRRRILVIAGTAALTFLTTLVAFWPRPDADKGKAGTAHALAREAQTAIAPSQPPGEATARPTADQVPVATAPPPPSQPSASALKSHPMTAHHLESTHASAAKTTSKPSSATDSTASHAAAAPSKPATMGRDIGY